VSREQRQMLLRLLARHVKKKPHGHTYGGGETWAVIWANESAELHERYYRHGMTPFYKVYPTTLSETWALATLAVQVHMHMGAHSALAIVAARGVATVKKVRLKNPPLAFERLVYLARGEHNCVLDGAPCRWRAPPETGKTYDDEVAKWLTDPRGISELYLAGEKGGVHFIIYVVSLPWLESKWSASTEE